MTPKLVDYREWRTKALRDPAVRKALEEEDDAAINIALQLIRLRERHGWTQSQLARKLRTSQQAVARLESLNYAGYTLKVLEKIAGAFKKRLRVEFV